MSNVLIDRQKIDILANAISDKSGVPVTMTLDEMVEAVDGIETGGGEPTLQAKTYTVNSAGTATVTADSGYDGLSSVAVSVPSMNAWDFVLSRYNYTTVNGKRYWKPNVGIEVYSEGEGWITEGAYTDTDTFNAVASNTTITPTESSQTIGGANYMMEGAVTVNAIPSNYVGSGITQRSSSDLTASGATVTVPSGYYSAQASKAVASGTAGTPTATKGTVSNHQVSVTPSVTNTAGYISGGTKTGTAVTVSASELVSGTYTVDSSGTKNVTNYASASVPAGTAGTPSASKGTVSNHSVSVTPSVTNTTGWITGSTKTGTAVTVSASELASGNKAITENGTDIDVVGYSTVSVDVQGGGSATYRLDNIVPEQTITTSTTYSRAYGGAIQNYTETPQVGEMYLVTYDGAEYVCEGYRGDSTGYVIGEYRLFTSTTVNQYMSVPFACAYYSEDGFALVTRDTNAHTIKVDKLTFIDDGETFTTKTITQNGTYNASSDSADGYSSVTVNVPSSSPTIQSLTVNPSTTQQTFNASGVDGYKPVTVNAMPSGTAGTPTATKGTVSNHSVSVTPSVTNQTGYITGSTKTGTAVTVSASELVSGSQTITQNGTVDVTNLAEVVVEVEGGSGSGMTVATATATPSSASASISFTGLSGEPTSFAVISSADLATGASPYKTAAVVFDGSDLHGQTITNTSNAQVSYDGTHFSKTYSNGTLTITGSTYWQANQYTLVYTYGGNSANIDTADVQVGSGATSITFTGLTDEPDYFSCIFKSNFATSSGYQRVIAVVYDGNSTYGLAMDSGAKAESSWSYTYNNGSLTISSQGTNNGGYFHQPGYYQLTYGIGGTVEPTEIEVEPLSVTQNGTYTAPTGKAYSPVTVNVSGGSVNIDTKSMTNSSNQNTSISFSSMKGQPKAFFARCTSTLSRSSSNTYYYVADMVYNGTSTVGNMHARSNGQYSNITSGYSWSYSGTTLTLSSSGARNTSPGSFYNGTYELVYVY